MDSEIGTPYMLYYASHSICSLMVRLTYDFRGPSKDGAPDMQLILKEVDIGGGHEQLTEEYLCEINKEGYVPVLVNKDALSRPLPESVDITYYFCDRYPQLLPGEHASTIRRLITELHNISFYSLTFGLMPARGLAIQDKIDGLLKEPNISDRYRKALLHKKARRLDMEEHIVPDKIKTNEELARKFNDEIQTLVQKYNPDGQGRYIFGSFPTALDAHTICFLARLRDKGRDYLIPDVLLDYVNHWRGSDEWKNILPEISTVPGYVK